MKNFGYIQQTDLRYVTSEFHLRSFWSESFFDNGNAVFVVEPSFINMWSREGHKAQNYKTLRYFYPSYPINNISVGIDGIENIEPSDEFMLESIIPPRSSEEFGIILPDGSVRVGKRGQDFVDVVAGANYESVNDCLIKGCSIYSSFKNDLYIQTSININKNLKKWLARRPKQSRISMDLVDGKGTTKVLKNFRSMVDAIIYLNSLNIWGDK